jgi:hypothetical protein
MRDASVTEGDVGWEFTSEARDRRNQLWAATWSKSSRLLQGHVATMFHRVRQPMPWTKTGSQIIDGEDWNFSWSNRVSGESAVFWLTVMILKWGVRSVKERYFVCTVYFVLADQTTARRIEQQWFTGHLANREETSAEISSGIISLALSVVCLLASET